MSYYKNVTIIKELNDDVNPGAGVNETRIVMTVDISWVDLFIEAFQAQAKTELEKEEKGINRDPYNSNQMSYFARLLTAAKNN